MYSCLRKTQLGPYLKLSLRIFLKISLVFTNMTKSQQKYKLCEQIIY